MGFYGLSDVVQLLINNEAKPWCPVSSAICSVAVKPSSYYVLLDCRDTLLVREKTNNLRYLMTMPQYKNYHKSSRTRLREPDPIKIGRRNICGRKTCIHSDLNPDRLKTLWFNRKYDWRLYPLRSTSDIADETASPPHEAVATSHNILAGALARTGSKQPRRRVNIQHLITWIERPQPQSLLRSDCSEPGWPVFRPEACMPGPAQPNFLKPNQAIDLSIIFP
jgi:hypothetical protein